MWNFVNTMGHPGQVMGPYIQKRDFSIHIQSVPIVPGKTFTNPNFVNKHHPSVHSYQNHLILSPSRIDSSNLNKSKDRTNSALINSSQSIVNKVKENNIDVNTVKPNSEESITITQPSSMCSSRKRNRRNRRGRRQKAPGKNSKQNNNKQQISDMMDIDLELESPVNISDISMSPKIQNNIFNLTDFVKEIPTKSKLLKDVNNRGESDEEELIATVVSVSPPNIYTSCTRNRQLSITESEDSFIIFDSGTDEELEFSEESEDESQCQEEEEELDSSSSVIPQKRVRFADDSELCEVHPMVQWSFAYQQARKGPWEEYARDRDRFSKRIADTEKILSPIFDAKHRKKVYQERFKDKTYFI